MKNQFICGQCGSDFTHELEKCPVCGGKWEIWQWHKPPAKDSPEYLKWHRQERQTLDEIPHCLFCGAVLQFQNRWADEKPKVWYCQCCDYYFSVEELLNAK